MTVISRLSAYLFADTANFEAGMKRSAKRMDEFQQTTSAASKKASLALAGVAAAMTALVVHQSSAIDASLKQAHSLGISVREFDAMSRVASEAGVDQQGFTKAILDTQKALFAAATGSVEAQNMFKALRLDVSELLRLSPDKQFEKIAGALAGIENPTERATIATKLYGKEGREVINMLDDYKEKLADARSFNDKFNLSVNEIDSKKVSEARDTFGRVADVSKGLANVIAVQLAPLVTYLGNEFINSGLDGQQFGVSVSKGLSVAAESIDLVNEEILGIRAAFIDLKVFADELVLGIDNSVLKTLQTLEKLPGIGSKFSSAVAAVQDEIKSDSGWLDKDLKDYQDLSDEAANYVTTAQKIAKIQQDADARAKKSVKVTPVVIPPIKSEGIAQLAEAEKRQKELLKSIVGPTMELAQTMSDLNILYKNGKITADQYSDALAKIRLQIAELDKTEEGGFIAGLMKINLQMKDVGNTAEESIVSSFNEIVGTSTKLQTQIDGLNVLFEKGLITQKQYADAVLQSQIAMSELDKTASGGFTTGMLKVKQQLEDVSSLSENLVTDAFSKAEDAIVNFAMTGKLSVKDMVNSMIADFIRLQVRQSIEAPLFDALSGFLGLPGPAQTINWNQGGSSVVHDTGIQMPSFDVGTDYVPRDMVAKIHKGEKIVPAAQNARGGDLSLSVTVNNNAGVQVSQQARRGADGSTQLLITLDKLMESNARNPLSRFNQALRDSASAPSVRY